MSTLKIYSSSLFPLKSKHFSSVLFLHSLGKGVNTARGSLVPSDCRKKGERWTRVLLSLEKSVFFFSSEVCKLLCTLLRVGDAQWLLLIVIKVAGVTSTLAFRGEWSFNLNRWREQRLKMKIIMKNS